MKAKPIATVRGVPIYTDEKQPEYAWWFCKDGGVRQMSMESCDEPCEGCDCGYAALMKQIEDDG